MKLLSVFGIAAVFCGAGAAQTVAPNPGGSLVITNSTTATIQYVDTPVTQRVDSYSTTITAKLNGNVVFSHTYAASYGDAAVQQAVAQADAVLAGDTFGVPQLTSTTTVLQSSIPTTPSPVTCEQAASVGVATGLLTTSTTTTFGPATINVGPCQAEIFYVLAGQEDINVNLDTEYSVARNVPTTDTYLTTQQYTITATGTALNVPVLSPLLLALLGVGLCFIVLRHLRFG